MRAACVEFAPFRWLGGRLLIALDEMEHFCSQKLGCPRCLKRKPSNGKAESDHIHALRHGGGSRPRHGSAAHAGVHRAGGGAEKQDCERSAVERWLATHADRVKDLRPIFLGDHLFAWQPVVDAMVAVSADVLLTAKPTSCKGAAI